MYSPNLSACFFRGGTIQCKKALDEMQPDGKHIWSTYTGTHSRRFWFSGFRVGPECCVALCLKPRRLSWWALLRLDYCLRFSAVSNSDLTCDVWKSVNIQGIGTWGRGELKLHKLSNRESRKGMLLVTQFLFRSCVWRILYLITLNVTKNVTNEY